MKVELRTIIDNFNKEDLLSILYMFVDELEEIKDSEILSLEDSDCEQELSKNYLKFLITEINTYKCLIEALEENEPEE